MLNGSGYPRRIAGDDIPIQTRLITVADIFDALTASDRPYKGAVTAEKALEILQAEAEAGRLDAELVRVMRESGVYRHLPKTRLREL
jgi:HD-GYP domain-containing protein (c-di-GMP phosphodiesterase class II)